MSCSVAPYRIDPSIKNIPVLKKRVAGPKKKYVLKLRVVNSEGSSQISRVRLPQIQVNGNICHSALVGVAVRYTFSDASLVSDEYDVIFTYYDIDNDCVNIASTEELIDAIKQFTSSENDNVCLRISADVKRKSAVKDGPKNKKYSDKSRGIEETARPQNIVESFVSILTNVIDSLQNQKIVTRQSKAPITNERTKPVTRVAKSNAIGQGKKNERPFLHGRHTCDGCVCTPIIGKRYHATNVINYDLCGPCRINYTGNEIKFQIVELERDRQSQERWCQKKAKLGRGGSRHHKISERRHPGNPHWQQGEIDATLKEAIRRSLEDAALQQGVIDSHAHPTPESNRQLDASTEVEAVSAISDTIDKLESMKSVPETEKMGVQEESSDSLNATVRDEFTNTNYVSTINKEANEEQKYASEAKSKRDIIDGSNVTSGGIDESKRMLDSSEDEWQVVAEEK